MKFATADRETGVEGFQKGRDDSRTGDSIRR